jgi:WD40 repeat protein
MKLEKPRDLTLPTSVFGLAIVPDGSRLFATCLDGQVYEVDPANGARTVFAEKHQSYAIGCVLLPDGRTLISGGYDGALIWHDVESKKTIRRVQAHQFWSRQMALSPGGDFVASVTGQYLAGGDKYEPATESEPSVKIYDTDSGDLVQAFSHVPPVLSVAFSPDGEFVAAGNLMGEVHVWDVASGRQVAQFTSPDFTCWGIIKSPHYVGGIYGLAFAPDGRSLVCCGMGPMTDPMAGNGKMTWQRWAWQENKMLGQIHDGEHGSGLMETLAFAPDGSAFLMAGRQAQGTWNAAVFSAADGKLIASLDTKSRVTRAHFAEDGRTLYLSATHGQGPREKESKKWPECGRIHIVPVTTVAPAPPPAQAPKA